MSLEELCKKIQACEKCDLHRISDGKVCGEGSKDAGLIILGIAPGKEEIEQGRPFVGPSGRKLRSKLETICGKFGIDPASYIYITNLVKCFPNVEKKVKDPTKNQIQICADFLLEEISLLHKANCIVILGELPASYFRLGKLSTFGNNPKPIKIGDKTLACFRTYHPSYLVRTHDQQASRHFHTILVKALISSWLTYQAKY